MQILSNPTSASNVRESPKFSLWGRYYVPQNVFLVTLIQTARYNYEDMLHTSSDENTQQVVPRLQRS